MELKPRNDICELTTNGDPITIAWRNVGYAAPKRWMSGCGSIHKRRMIIQHITGHCRLHTLNAFLGPSGSGKTTLLNCLTGNAHACSGSEIYFLKKPGEESGAGEGGASSTGIRMIGQHVHETMFHKMTVQQTLTYAFRFKNANHKASAQQINQHIIDVLKELMLDESIMPRPVGMCSGGQQRRIAIAHELMDLIGPIKTNGMFFLFVDEPTTGLDSNAAYLVMKCLKRLAVRHPITIIVSIHTPSSDVLHLFHKVMVLAKGGVCIYSGCPYRLNEQLHKFVPKMQSSQTTLPIERFLKIACDGVSDECVRMMADYTFQNENRTLNECFDSNKYESNIRIEYKSFEWNDLWIQFNRAMFITFWMDGKLFLGVLAAFGALFGVYGSMFDGDMVKPSTCLNLANLDNSSSSSSTSPDMCKEKLNDEIYTHAYIGYQTFLMVYLGTFVCAYSGYAMAKHLKVFLVQHFNQWYSMSTFYWSQSIVSLLQMLILSIHFTLLFYVNVDHRYIDGGHWNWNRFLHFMLFITIFIIYLQSYGQLFGVLFNDRMVMVSIVSIYAYMFMHVCDGYQLKLSMIQNPFIIMQSQWIALKAITNGMLYTFYGLERCHQPYEISYVLLDYDIDANSIYDAIWHVARNIIIIRMVTFVSLWRISCRNRTIQTKTNKIAQQLDLLLDLEPEIQKPGIHNPEIKIEVSKPAIERIKSAQEKCFEEFVQQRILIGWRSLTLFMNESIFEIRNIRTNSTDSNEKKIILKNLNGELRYKTLNALMGPSGCGKTSLLKVLNGQLKTRLSFQTEFYVTKYTPIRTCYLTQEVSGHLWPGLTCKQSLLYASRLKNSMYNQNDIDHEQISHNLMMELDIEDAAETEVSKLSGGQRKRLALALELTSLQMPNLVCIDEPTSGLDSNSSLIVIECLKKLTINHCLTIVVSIHQPNNELLSIFDHVYLLGKGGISLYSGNAQNIERYLRMVQVETEQEEQEKQLLPIEKLMKYSCLDADEPVIERMVKLNQISDLNEDVRLMVDGVTLNRTRFSLRSVRFLFIRYLLHVAGYLWLPYAVFVLLMTFYGFTLSSLFDPGIAQQDGCISLDDNFNNTCAVWDHKQRQDLEANFHYTFYVNNIFLFLILTGSSFMFSMQNVYFKNEHRNGWYSTGAFYVVKTVTDMVIMLVSLSIYLYLSIGMHQAIRPYIYPWMLLAMFLSSISCQAVGQLCAILFGAKNAAMLSLTTMSIFLVSALSTNYFTHYSKLNAIWQLVSTINLFRYHNEVSFVLQYGFGRCRPREIQIILNHFGINHDEHLYHCLVMLCVNVIIYHSLAFATIFYKHNQLFPNRKLKTNQFLQQQKQHNKNDFLMPGLTCHY